jgi:hypothetical protein
MIKNTVNVKQPTVIVFTIYISWYRQLTPPQQACLHFFLHVPPTNPTPTTIYISPTVHSLLQISLSHSPPFPTLPCHMGSTRVNWDNLMQGANWCSLVKTSLVDSTKGQRHRGFWSNLLIWKGGHDCSSKEVFTRLHQCAPCVKLPKFTLPLSLASLFHWSVLLHSIDTCHNHARGAKRSMNILHCMNKLWLGRGRQVK